MNGISLVHCVKKEPYLDTTHNLILLGKDSQTQTKQLSKEDLVALDTVRKKTKCTNDSVNIRTPPPPAVARRNARERNRVKQVNNGFANLRQHIPNSIAAAFESGKNGNKKLSKVETLRMAVEYIRSLEDLLELSNDLPTTTDKSNYEPSLPLASLNIDSSSNYSASLASPLSDDDISNNSLSSPIQYVKISGHGDTFQLVPVNILQNSEQFIKSEHDIKYKYKNVQLLNATDNHIPLSPEIYSENSLSPGAESDIQSLIPVFNVEQLSSTSIPIKIDDVSKLPTEEMRILCRNLIMLQGESQEVGKSLNINELISW